MLKMFYHSKPINLSGNQQELGAVRPGAYALTQVRKDLPALGHPLIVTQIHPDTAQTRVHLAQN